MFIFPMIEEAEIEHIKGEATNQHMAIAFDGTTRLGEAICCTGRWCDADFKLHVRLLDFTTVAKHVDNRELAAHISEDVLRKRNIPASLLAGISRDSVSVNGAACRRLTNVYSNAADVLCCCHTLCHVGEHFQLPTLDEFRTPWLELVGGRNPHAGAKMLWKAAVAPAQVPGFSNVRWYSWAEITFVIAEAGMKTLEDFIRLLNEKEYGNATREKLNEILNTKKTQLQLDLAAMRDMRLLVKTTYELEGDRLESMLVYERLTTLRVLGRAIQREDDGVLPNVDAVLRHEMKLQEGVKVAKYFDGSGICIGRLMQLDQVESTLYPGEERDAWLVRRYDDGHTEHFEEEELRSGKAGPHPTGGQDGKPYLVVQDHPERHRICEQGLYRGFQYLENRLTGECQDQYSCVKMLELCRVIRIFDPNFAASHLNPAFIDSLDCVTPVSTSGALPDLKTESPRYLAAAEEAPTFDTHK